MIAPGDGHHARRAHHRRRGRHRGLDAALRAADRRHLRPARRRRLHVHQRHRAAAGLRRLGRRPDPAEFTAARDRGLPRPRQQLQADAEGVTKRDHGRGSPAPPPRTTRSTVARTVARDNLVKTAIFGATPTGAASLRRGRHARRPTSSRTGSTSPINGVLLCRGGVAAGGPRRRRTCRAGRCSSRSSSALGDAAPRTSSPPTCRTPTSRRTVPTPHDAPDQPPLRTTRRPAWRTPAEGGRARRGAALAAAVPRRASSWSSTAATR